MDDGGGDRTGALRRALPLLLLLAAAALALALLGDRLTLAALRENRAALLAFRDAHYALAALSYVAGYAAAVALSLPGGLVMTLAGGFLFGWLPATAMTVVAATAGATLLFLAARRGIGAAVHARMLARAREGGLLRRLERGLRANELSMLLIIRLVPVVPFFLANLAPAFLGVGLRAYVLTTFLGIIPGTLVFASVGAGLGEVFAAGRDPDLGVILSPPVLLPLLGLAALALLPVLLRALRPRSLP